MADEKKDAATTSAAKPKDKDGIKPFAERTPKAGMLLVKIYTPFVTFFEGDAQSLTALNESGPFDVLPGHHNFITMLTPCIVKVLDGQKETKEIPISRGLMHIRQDKLIIFLDV